MSKVSSIKRSLQSSVLYRYISICRHPEKITDAINSQRPNVDAKERRRLERKIRMTFAKYGWSPYEYLFEDFDKFSKADVRDFVPFYEYISLCSQFNDAQGFAISEDKWASYLFLEKYYGRKAFLLPGKVTEIKGALIDELNNHWPGEGNEMAKFIIKPLSLDSGIGVQILSVPLPFDQAKVAELVESYPEGSIIEEVIEQAHFMAQFHPRSVNTVRISTLRMGDDVRVFLPFARIGRSGNIVDNTHNGGILVPIDINTGVLQAASTIDYTRYPKHPDTGCQIEGVQIPMWEEAKAMVEELAMKFDHLQLIGWDLALTDKGWVIVEINSSPGIPVVKRHFRSEFESLKRFVAEHQD